MPSSYTPLLRLTLPADGELVGTWGQTVNNGITSLEEAAIAGVANIALVDANRVLTVANGAADEARNAVLQITGALTAQRDIIIPNNTKTYFVRNSTTGGFGVRIKTAAGAGIVVPANGATLVYCDGVNVGQAITAPGALTVTDIDGTPDLILKSSGTEKMRILANGNVGIGTATPALSLHVYRAVGAAVVFAQTAGTSDALFRAKTSLGEWGCGVGIGVNANRWNVYDFGTAAERMVIDAVGNVGIGIANTSQAKLTVNPVGGIGANLLLPTAYAFGGSNWAIQVSGDAASRGYLGQWNAQGGMAMQEGGYYEGGGNTRLQNGSTTYSAVACQLGNVVFSATAGQPANGLLGGNERMRIDPAGNIGMGSTGNGSRLSIVGGALSTGGGVGISGSIASGRLQAGGEVNVYHSYYDTSSAEFSAASSAGSVSGITVAGASAPVAPGTVRLWTANVERMRISVSGFLGVGGLPGSGGHLIAQTTGSWALVTESPAGSGGSGTTYQNLLCAINGDSANLSYFTGYARGGIVIGSIQQASTSSVSFNTSSDRRLKEAIADLQGSGSFIDALRPRTWNWRDGGEQGVGFVADELASVSRRMVTGAPDAVDAAGLPRYQMISYSDPELIANMVAELKDLRARVAALEV